LYSSAGPDFIRRLSDDGAKIFLELKLHDIPNTVAKALSSLSRLGAGWTTIHISGGEAMVRAARDAVAASENPQLKILGVTVLTSMDQAALRSVNIELDPQSQVVDLASKGKKWGLDGVICSPLELKGLRAKIPHPYLTVVPGIRPKGEAGGDDQARVASPAEAAKDGASYIVVGRPILNAQDPVAQVSSILKAIGAKP
jgi:orotidine-5'-phosphate decarboxylase